MSDLVGRIELGPIAAGVFERSKFDNAIIVGSEIRAALGEQRKTIERLQAEVELLRVVVDAAERHIAVWDDADAGLEAALRGLRENSNDS